MDINPFFIFFNDPIKEYFSRNTFIYQKQRYNMPEFNTTVKLIGEDGNAFSVLSKVSKALRTLENSGDAPQGTERRYLTEAMDGDYNHLLDVTSKYVSIE